MRNGLALVVVVWLVIGAIASGQRDYFSNEPKNCSKTSTIAVTILAGPLNYIGANPKISCKKVKPSK